MDKNIDVDFLVKSFDSIREKDYQVLHDLNHNIDTLLKTQLLIQYHIAKSRLTDIFTQNTNKDLYLSIWTEPSAISQLEKKIESKVIFKKDKENISSIDHYDQMQVSKQIAGIFGVITKINVNWIGNVRKYCDNEIHDIQISKESLPLIDELILNKELNKIYHTTVLTHSLPKEDNTPKCKKMKV